MTFSDEDLRNYLDGALAADRAAELETALAQNPALEERLMVLDPLSGMNAGTQDAFLAPTEDQSAAWQATLSSAAAPQAGYRFAHLAAAAVVGAVIVGAGWFASNDNTAPDWRANVATYQALYSAETIAALDADSAALSAQLDQLEDQLGFTGLERVVDGIEGLTPLRGQILAHDGKPLGQIVFATEDGQPVALCLIGRSTSVADVVARLGQMEGMASAAFESAGHAWLLIGTEDAALIEDVAGQVIAQIGLL